MKTKPAPPINANTGAGYSHQLPRCEWLEINRDNLIALLDIAFKS